MLQELPRERWASVLGGVVSGAPAVIAAGFVPAWDVLPFLVWLAIAALGSALAGVIMAPSLRGVLAGALTGGGLLLGVAGYVALHGASKLGLFLAIVLGAMPGMVLFNRWARPQALARLDRAGRQVPP